MLLWGSEHKGLLIPKDSENNVNEFVHDRTASHLGQLRFALFQIVVGEDRIEIFPIALSGNAKQQGRSHGVCGDNVRGFGSLHELTAKPEIFEICLILRLLDGVFFSRCLQKVK